MRILKIALRKRGEQDYRDIYTITEDLGGLDVADNVEMFLPQGQHTTGVLVMETTNNLVNRVFDRSGVYELRAYLRDSKEFTGAAEPVEVHVVEISDDQLRAAEDASKVIVYGTMGGIADELSESKLLAAVEALEECELKRTGRILAAIAALRDANTRDGFEEARKRIAELRKDCPEPMQDWISLTLANTLRSINQFELALEEIRHLPKDSFERDPVERVLLQQIESASRAQ